jgi:hypothetical protein
MSSKKEVKMKYWQAQIGLGDRVHNEYYGYVEVRDYNPNEFELPNPLLMMYLTRKNNTKAQQFVQKMQNDVSAIFINIIKQSDGVPIAAQTKQLAIDTIQATFKEGFLNVLGIDKAVLEEGLIMAFNLGVLLANTDPKRCGERPVVALGLHKEVLKKLQIVTKERGELLGDFCSILQHKGFYLTRASSR